MCGSQRSPKISSSSHMTNALLVTPDSQQCPLCICSICGHPVDHTYCLLLITHQLRYRIQPHTGLINTNAVHSHYILCVCICVCVCVRERDFTESWPEIKKGVTEIPRPQIYTRTHWEPWPSPLPATSLQSPGHHERVSRCNSSPPPSSFLPLNCPQIPQLFSLSRASSPCLPWGGEPPLSTSTPCPVASLWVQGLLSLEGRHCCEAPSLLFFAE